MNISFNVGQSVNISLYVGQSVKTDHVNAFLHGRLLEFVNKT